MQSDLKVIAEELKRFDSYTLLVHRKPDGDAIGSSLALYVALKQFGKKVCIACADVFPKRYCFLYPEVLSAFQKRSSSMGDFYIYGDTEAFGKQIVTLDTAAKQLMGAALEIYADQIMICIDHHQNHSLEASYRFVEKEAAANCENIYELLLQMKAELTPVIASSLYTGICTDTGCFKYRNVRPKTHHIAARLMECGIDAAYINRLFFEVKSKGRFALEKLVYDSVAFFYENKAALVIITQKQMQKVGASEDDYEGIPAVLRSIQGVQIGITIKEEDLQRYKVSVRTGEKINAMEFCRVFGGGGHFNAAGCTIYGEESAVKARLLEQLHEVFC